MTQEAMNKGRVLYELGLDREQVEEAFRVLMLVPELMEVLENPVISKQKKHAIIDAVYSRCDCPKKLLNFIKVICDHKEIGKIEDIYHAYYDYWDEKNNIKRVRCTFAREPEQNEMAGIKAFLEGKYAGKELVYETCVNPDILGGVIVRVGNEEYNWSYEERIRQLERILKG